jgi:hypothetical protein
VTNTEIIADGQTIVAFTDTLISDDLDESPVFEIVERVRAEEVEVIDRGNVQTTFTFVVGRSHNSLIEAHDYRLMFRKRVPRFAELVTITTKDFAGGEKKWYLANAGIKARRPQSTGVYTYAEVTIIGGLIQDVK